MAKNSIRKRGKNYYYSWTDANGKRREAVGCPDKRVTEEMQRKARSDAAQAKAGLVDPRMQRVADANRQDIAEHIDVFVKGMKAKNLNAQHVQQTEYCCRRVVELGRIRDLAGVTNSAVLKAVSSLKDEGLSPRTCNAYITAFRSMIRFLWHDGRLTHDPLAGFKKLDETSDRRIQRRPLTADELKRLIETTERSGNSHGKSGEDRAVYYLIASMTGLRRGEIMSLTPESFHLDDDPPVVVCEAAYTKAGVRAEQPLPEFLVGRLRTWLAGQPSGKAMFRTLPTHTGKMVAEDLKRAGIEPVDPSGRIVDGHALRHTYITMLAKAGVPIKTLQTLARHSSPVLSLNVYSHLTVFDTAAALNALPDLSSQPATQALAATGTTNATPAAHLPQLQTGTCLQLAVTVASVSTTDERNVLQDQPLDANCRNGTDAVGIGGVCSSSPNARRLVCEVSSATQDKPIGSVIQPAALPYICRTEPSDPDLAAVIDAWPNLPEAIRAGIMAMVRSSQPNPGRKRR